jgi:2-succinyl-5-enolpyruvyl-6-hydroxy-3-cyclohexene-1-carboxylate synthase
MTPENLLGEWARLLVESLADAGLREAVISPGSRSTPLACAALASSRLRCTSVVDERSAGFHALGFARVTGRPAAVICTSGSAAANYFPAVVEAAMARVPLLVVTADRPPELQDCSASQTLDQIKLYGGYVRRFVELGMPDPSPAALIGLRRRAVQSLLDTFTSEPGPVHVNFRARKPLEPAAAASHQAVELTRRVDEILRSPATARAEARVGATEVDVGALADACTADEHGLIVCGPAAIGTSRAGTAVARLAVATGFPVFAEATSQLRFDGTTDLAPGLTLDGLDVMLRSSGFRDAFQPRVVLEVGDPPTSGAWERLVAARPELSRHVVAAHGWPDPHGTARSLTIADVEDTVSRLASDVGSRRRPPATQWAELLARANHAAWAAVDEALAAEPAISEIGAVRAVVAAMPRGALLCVGNSLPVRHLDVACRANPDAKLMVGSQRGVSGIDGLVSGAAGAARAAKRPTAALIGDVSALHDLGGFAAARDVEVPLVVVVLNNDGGRIFEQLPLVEAGLPDAALRFWTTPHAMHFDALANLFRLRYERTTTLAELRAALDAGLRVQGCTLIEVPVPPHGARTFSANLAARVDAAVAPLLSALVRR